MKKKRLKSSNSTHSIKKKRRKQEYSFVNHEYNAFRNSQTGSAPFMLDEEQDIPRSEYKYTHDPLKNYCYGFTNSKFIYFIANLSPTEYLIFISLISWIIYEELNAQEAKIIYAFLNNVTDGIQTLVEQELILENFKHKKTTIEQGDALQHDIDALFFEIDKLKKAIK